jgi:hypothetical protein
MIAEITGINTLKKKVPYQTKEGFVSSTELKKGFENCNEFETFLKVS